MKIYVDVREKESEVPRYLTGLGVTVIFKQLPVGDYLIAEKVVAERKSVGDLAKSVFDGRFFNQLSRLTQSASRCFLVVEGDLEKLKYITSNYRAVLAALYYSSVISRVPIVLTDSPKHTAEILKYFSMKLQEKPRVLGDVARGKPRGEAVGKWQLYVVSALPGIGARTAEKLLKKFGSVKNVFNASIPELVSVEGVSEEKASLIFRIINEPYVKKQVKSLESFIGEDRGGE
ncbi:MAG: ERCC4 domain-containing protein [Sulfolobales archaeon]|nr:helix-hairpin-helix domain-containing protein [Sulfolobales archaeon]MCX8208586.1 helix-hairpin-helix domain-containing protein [Sulfolobales archaeon]MDW8010468.1 ERCC4 domain-containing protein [Sulfolobales archaeon]